MHIHILGICGTFMGSLALLARASGHKVTGCDAGVYPPMSTQLEEQGIELIEGFSEEQLELNPDLFIVGNAISRGNPLLEAILNKGLNYESGPGFLGKELLRDRWVLAVSGTHGKTTTTSMLAWILEYAGMAPGFLVGGIPQNFGLSARLGDTPFFVIEADEYDTAFFDKRSKFVHYRPRTLIFNNLEFDHADIFADLTAIQTQFHHLIRTIPEQGKIIYPAGVPAIEETLAKGCWSETQSFSYQKGSDENTLSFSMIEDDGSKYEVSYSGPEGNQTVDVNWALNGLHNVQNGIAAMMAAHHVGVTFEHSAEALGKFESVKRRMELLGQFDTSGNEISVYDDFAHHPTAIRTTLDGLRKKVGEERVIAVIEPRSNTMKQGVHGDDLIKSAELADQIIWADLAELDWLEQSVATAGEKHLLGVSIDELIEKIVHSLIGKTHVVIMSNGGFGGIHAKLIARLSESD